MKSLIFLLTTLFFFSDQNSMIFSGPSNTDGVCLNPEEKKLYELIMAYRASQKLKHIPFSAKLTRVAQTHVSDLMKNFDYENRKGCNPHSWSNKGKWTSCCYTPDHQQAKCMWDKPKEIAGYDGNGFEIAYYSSASATAKEGLEGWKTSSGHNPLLINSGIWSKVEWKAVGIGIHENYAVVWFGEVEDQSEITLCP